MQHDFAAFPSLESAFNDRYRGHVDRDWQEWQVNHFREDAAAIPAITDRAWLARNGRNYCGLSDRQALRHLVAANVDQPFLEEIGTLANLRRLELEWPFVATDLAPLLALERLEHLSIDSPRKLADFSPLLALPSLRTLIITNAREMTDLSWLAAADRLEVIGIEGAIDSPFRIDSLEPLAGLPSLRAFLAVSTRLASKDLMPLARCEQLRFLDIAQVAPRAEFERLHAARPDIVCRWFDPAAWQKHRLRAALTQ